MVMILLIIALGYTIYDLYNRDTPTAPIVVEDEISIVDLMKQANHTRTIALHGTATQLGTTAQIYLNDSTSQYAIDVSELTPVSENQVYVLWAQVGDSMSLVHSFAPNDQHVVLPRLHYNAEYLITREEGIIPSQPDLIRTIVTSY